ncbi:hypothetical protein ASC61_01235 [Aeromicrobium sp. Root344]|uniref:hypothetical protein n=1 Tax=Aeromicrobium sp. Root344 TaxID=1736521 RepID=UPI000700EA3F|nr:hypothetical protein [Aeromicrobium sp. Root344]KQV73745.1 hypothetical protein ASC61_01235 [Aeromicrobium sp. Root344]
MSTGNLSGRNRLVVPAAAAGIVIVIILGVLLVRGGGDDTPTEPKATKTTPAAGTKAPQDKLKGSGDAPDEIAVKTATVARGATVFAIGAEIPDIDLKKIDSVSLVLGQDNGKVLWRVTTFQDARGAFVFPQLYLAKDGKDEQYACASVMRIRGPQLSMTVPLKCLDNPEKPLRARLEITDRDGGEEKTSTSKVLDAPKS